MICRPIYLCGAALLLLTAAALGVRRPGEYSLDTPAQVALFVGLCLAACAIYAACVRLVLRQPVGLAPVLAVAVLLRLTVLIAPPFLSTDLYRYVWDGRVQLAGINPYVFIPDAPELRALRDEAIFARLNRPDYARTIYPPAAEMIYRLIAMLWQSPFAIKTAMTLFDLVTIAVLIRLLGMSGRPSSQVLIYAWHPLPVWEFSGNGHVDAAAICLESLALWAFMRGRRAASSWALSTAVLVKLLPVVLMPAIWRPWDWVVPAVFVVTVTAGYLFYIDAGWHVLGFLPQYAAEEGVDNGTGLFALIALSRLLGTLPVWAAPVYLASLALLLLGCGAAISFRGIAPVRGLLLQASTLTVGFSPHYPWYFAWLLLPCCLLPSMAVIYLTSAAFLIYLASYSATILYACLIYLPFLLLAACDLIRPPDRKWTSLQRS